MKTNIREYNEEAPVEIQSSNYETIPSGLTGLMKIFRGNNSERICIVATNEGGYNSTCVDLMDVLKWCHENGITYKP